MTAERAADDVVVLVTAAAADEAERIATALVTERLAACVNIVGPIRSIYRWQGAIERADEHLLLVKTQMQLFEAVASRVSEMHSYTTPEIIAVPVEAGTSAYLAWLAESTALT